MDRKVKIWVGVGAYLVASTSHPALMTGDAADGQGPIDLFPSAHAAGGEGSEGGEGMKKKAGGEGGEGSEGGEAAGGEGGEKAGGEGGEGSEGGEAAGGEGGEKAGGEGGEAAGGEGGEGGEGSGGASFVATGDVNNRFMTNLTLMKAHLRIGRELLAAGDREQAAKHFAHPQAEVYPDVENQLGLRGVKPFEGELTKLVELTSGNGDMAAIEHEYGEVLQAIDRAAATIGEETRRSPAFVADVVGRLLRNAEHEYEEAVSDGRIADAEEYQDGRGMILAARDLLDGVGEDIAKYAGHEYDEVKEDFGKLAKAFPSAAPPADPVAPEEVEKVVDHMLHELEEIAEHAPGGEGGEMAGGEGGEKAAGGEGGEKAGGEGGEMAGGEGGEGSEGGEGAEGGEGGEAGKSN